MASSKTTRILFAGLAGLAAGIAIGILLAPERGSKTRKRLRKKLREVSDNFKEEFSEELEKINRVLHHTDGKEHETDVKKKTPKNKP